MVLAESIRQNSFDGASAELLSRAGLFAARYTAVATLSGADAEKIQDSDIIDALKTFMAALWDRIGCRRERITSWKLIGERVKYELYGGGVNIDRLFGRSS